MDTSQYLQGDLQLLKQRLNKNRTDAESRKGERPTDHPTRDFALACHMQETMAQNALTYVNFVPPAYPPCTAPINDLRRVMVKDLFLETQHRGSYILLRAIAPPIRMAGILTVMEDEKNDVVSVELYHQEEENDRPAEDIVTIGTILLIKAPYFKAPTHENQTQYVQYCIRVDHITDVVRIPSNDVRVPQKWQPRVVDVNRSASSVKEEGNSAVRKKEYWKAVDKYSEAVQFPATTGEIATIKRNRALAYLNTKQYDAALVDTGYPNFEAVNYNEKSLFRSAEALYYLGRFDESYDVLKTLCSHYPENKRAKEILGRAQARLREKRIGAYDFRALQREAKQLHPPHLDHATYVGPIEIRKIDHKGRGLFVTKAVNVGELLLCEKAFGRANAKASTGGEMITARMTIAGKRRGFRETQPDLDTCLVHKMDRNPSLARQLTNLYYGQNHEADKPLSETSEHTVDTFLVWKTTMGNAINCPSSSLTMHKEKSDYMSCGLWVLASHINHACTGNVSLSWIGDMLIVRAAKDLSPGTEMTFWYRDPDIESFQEDLQKYWGFTCSCLICDDLKETSKEILTRRCGLLNKLTELFDAFPEFAIVQRKSKVSKLLVQAESTYSRPADEVPRLHLAKHQLPHAFVCIAQGKASEGLHWIRKGLTSLGFVFVGADTSSTKFTITKWGLKNANLVDAFMFSKKAFFDLGAHADGRRAYEYARLAYKLLVGEDETFGDTYKL